MNKKLKKLFKNPKAYFYDYFRKQVRTHPSGPVSLAVKMAFANAKTDLGYGKEIRKYLRQGKLEQAEKICIEGIGVVPRAISPIVLFADVGMRKGDFAEALNRWQKVIEKFPHKPDGYAGEARAYAALGDYEHVEQLSRNSIKNMPQELWPYIELAEISMRKGDFGEAIERWRVVRKKFPDKVQGYVRASVACCNLGRFAEAEELCRECMKVAPGDIRAYAEYAEVSLRQRDFGEALKRCQTVRERFPKRAVGYVRAAWAYSETKEYQKAEDLCRKSMEIAPKDIRSFTEFAQISMRKSNFEEAVNRWEIVRDKFPSNEKGYIGGGKAYLELHDHIRAEEVCMLGMKSLEGQPTKCRDIYYCLIDILLAQHGKAKECISIISKIENTLPDTITDRRYYYTLGKVLFLMLGRDKEEPHTQNTDFILYRLLNEPLFYSSQRLGITLLLYIACRDRLTFETIKNHFDITIEKYHLDNPLSVLVSSSSTNEDRINAHLKIIRENCYHNVQLCAYQTQNVQMLSKACDIVVESEEWKSLRPGFIFNFARSAIYADQDNGDKFIDTIYELYKGKNLSVADPIGLLCFRHSKRHDILKSISKLPINTHKKLNIALCISGQLRGYKGNLKYLVNTFGLDNHDYRIFIHTWRNIGRKFPNALHASRTFSGEFSRAFFVTFLNKPNIQKYIENQYPNFYKLLNNSSMASLDDLKDEYKTSDIVIDDEDDVPFFSWDNQEKMHYKIYSAHQLAVKSGEVFDLIVRIRPDLQRVTDEAIDLYEIANASRKNASIFTTSGLITLYSDDEYLIDDTFAIGIPEAMNVYANTYLDFKWHKENNTYLRTKQFRGHSTLEHNLFCKGVHVEKLKNKITGSFQDPDKIAINDIYAAIRMDVENRKKETADDKNLMTACEKDIGGM